MIEIFKFYDVSTPKEFQLRQTGCFEFITIIDLDLIESLL